ncbi:aminoglycoside 6-adenylyltransferase [Bacillus sp. P14.5]|uniref:aminoglycoside 6-adenylyltransferase n=1 Tax=Bacillus sp. P14.5 TaxID=1983400 RepID=UPI000DEB30E9|nr:aminoglycoside 6-adenylyltransferase [Bacillus sp. P14.5]
MRTENEMMDIILETARKDENIRAVYMNGSRTNPNVPKDLFQDYDIVYVVKETSPLIERKDWLKSFGELLMIQEPDRNDRVAGIQKDTANSYGYLMLFEDGNRIDLQLQAIEGMMARYLSDKLTVPLMDKDKILPPIQEPTDKDYHVKKPSEAQFFSSCNNFWWCQQNVVKGIWRDELPYAKYMFECIIRPHLDEAVSWWIGTKTDFGLSSGKLGKYFKNHLPASYWEMYQDTYSDGNYDNFWQAIFTACSLFRELAREVADSLSYIYPEQDDRNMTNYMERVRKLPKDAEGIY